MRKLVVATAGLAIVALAGVAGYVYMERENLVERAIEHYGSAILGATVQVDGVTLSPVDGEGAIRGLRIGNPPGFRKDVAQLSAIELAIAPKTIADQVVRVRRIAVLTPHIIYEQGGKGTNLEALQRNIARYVGETSHKERQASRRFIVDRLVIRGAQLTYMPLSGASDASIALRLPDITLVNIGKGRGGVTAGELSSIVLDALIARTATAIGQRALEHTFERLLNR